MEEFIEARDNFVRTVWAERWRLGILLGAVWLGCLTYAVVWAVWR